MTRSEAIARITTKLASLDDERVLTVADFIEKIATASDLPRALTERELALVEQSKEDFRTGRVLTPDEYRLEMDAFLQSRRAKQSTRA